MARGDETLTDQVRKHAKKPAGEKEKELNHDLLVPSGSTMLDLACSGKIEGAFIVGTMANIIGDRSSGKTMEVLSCLAECARRPRFDDYQLIYDGADSKLAFDIPAMFGKRLSERMEKAPCKSGKSETVKEFQSNVIKTIDKGKPFIYVQDSFDALTTDEEVERAYALANETKAKGSMGMQKAKGAHEFFRVLNSEIERSAGLLIIVSQVKENMDPMSFEKYTRTGGKALDFYAFHHIWLYMIGRIKKRVNGEEFTIGHNVKARVKKNKLNGAERDVLYDTYNTYGIDDIASMVDFMVLHKQFAKESQQEEEQETRRVRKKASDKKAIITIPAFNIEGTREQVIQAIDDNKLERKLKVMVRDAWIDIEERLKLDRRPRFS